MARLYKVSGEIKEVSPKDGKEFSLEELKAFVHGHIEAVRVYSDVYMFVNEEGILLDLPLNKNASLYLLRHKTGFTGFIVGDALLVLDPAETGD